jgi:hypothetical protein
MDNSKGNQMTTITIAGRDYTLHLDDVRTLGGGTLVRITGKRGADGALHFRNEGQYAGRALVVGIAALERLNWWDITRAVANLFPTCQQAVK